MSGLVVLLPLTGVRTGGNKIYKESKSAIFSVTTYSEYKVRNQVKGFVSLEILYKEM